MEQQLSNPGAFVFDFCSCNIFFLALRYFSAYTMACAVTGLPWFSWCNCQDYLYWKSIDL